MKTKNKKQKINKKSLKALSSELRSSKGFTLVEMMVAVALFSVVMTVSMGALLSLVDANRKAQAVQSVVNNLNVALDGMVRSIRMGTYYHCGTGLNLHAGKDCISTPESQIAFEAYGGSRSNKQDQWVYWLASDPGNNNVNRIYRSKASKTDTAVPITAPEIDITTFDVYVKGAEHALYDLQQDTEQPLAVIIVEGIAGSSITQGVSVFGSKKKIETKFQIQATASQRLLDI